MKPIIVNLRELFTTARSFAAYYIKNCEGRDKYLTTDGDQAVADALAKENPAMFAGLTKWTVRGFRAELDLVKYRKPSTRKYKAKYEDPHTITIPTADAATPASNFPEPDAPLFDAEHFKRAIIKSRRDLKSAPPPGAINGLTSRLDRIEAMVQAIYDALL